MCYNSLKTCHKNFTSLKSELRNIVVIFDKFYFVVK